MTANIKVETNTSKINKRSRKAYYKKITTAPTVPAISNESEFLAKWIVPYLVFRSVMKNKWRYNASGHGAQVALVEQNEADRAAGRTTQVITTYLLQKWRRKGTVPLPVYNYVNEIARLAPRSLTCLPIEQRRQIGGHVVALLTALPAYSATT